MRSPRLPGGGALLLGDGRPLRIEAQPSAHAARALIVEARTARGWTPVVVAPFTINAPSTCVYDIISQACR